MLVRKYCAVGHYMPSLWSSCLRIRRLWFYFEHGNFTPYGISAVKKPIESLTKFTLTLEIALLTHSCVGGRGGPWAPWVSNNYPRDLHRSLRLWLYCLYSLSVLRCEELNINTHKNSQATQANSCSWTTATMESSPKWNRVLYIWTLLWIAILLLLTLSDTFTVADEATPCRVWGTSLISLDRRHNITLPSFWIGRNTSNIYFK